LNLQPFLKLFSCYYAEQITGWSRLDQTPSTRGSEWSRKWWSAVWSSSVQLSLLRGSEQITIFYLSVISAYHFFQMQLSDCSLYYDRVIILSILQILKHLDMCIQYSGLM
jgi:hypothetical protein